MTKLLRTFNLEHRCHALLVLIFWTLNAFEKIGMLGMERWDQIVGYLRAFRIPEGELPVLVPMTLGLFAVMEGTAALFAGRALVAGPGKGYLPLVSVTSSEPDDSPGSGDGNTIGDIAGADLGTPDEEVDLRAERDGAGPGRVYQLTYRAVDASGNGTPAFAVVTVPHDKGSGPESLLMRLEPDGAPGMARIYWAAVPGALDYDVISGDLSQAKVVDHHLSLGAVSVLARGTTELSLSEGTGTIPPAGTVLFYLIQQRTERGGAGYGTESASWPRVPDSCGGGCP